MKILVLHNRYQNRGGEDSAVDAEVDLLVRHGHQARLVTVSNDNIRGVSAKMLTAAQTPYSVTSRRWLANILRSDRPEVVHVHNFFPLLSPSIYDACFDAAIPVVQTLHNFRTVCPNGLLMRDARVCKECLDSSLLRSIAYKCYRGSRAGTIAVAGMVGLHRALRTWHRKVTRFIALSEFARSVFVRAGFPADRISVKPNFCADPGAPAPGRKPGDYALFVGRLSPEKGARTLIRAWQDVVFPLRIVGDGPLHDELRATAPASVTFLGHLPSEQVSSAMQGARFLVIPSECYENFPVVIAEAFSHGVPVIASAIGSVKEIVDDGSTGLHVPPGDTRALAEGARWLTAHDDQRRRMGVAARAEYLARYTPARNYIALTRIYSALSQEAQS